MEGARRKVGQFARPSPGRVRFPRRGDQCKVANQRRLAMRVIGFFE
jgi:hypothetical protein